MIQKILMNLRKVSLILLAIFLINVFVGNISIAYKNINQENGKQN